MTQQTLTAIERTYVEAHKNVILAVSDCTKYITQTLRDQVDYLEEQIADEARIEELQQIARVTL
jgi:hypothetical protein